MFLSLGEKTRDLYPPAAIAPTPRGPEVTVQYAIDEMDGPKVMLVGATPRRALLLDT